MRCSGVKMWGVGQSGCEVQLSQDVCIVSQTSL